MVLLGLPAVFNAGNALPKVIVVISSVAALIIVSNRFGVLVVNHGKQGFIHLKEKQKERREKRKTRTHKLGSRQRDGSRGRTLPTARGTSSHAALGVEDVRKRTVLVITKRRVVGLWQPLLARSKTAEPLRAGVDNPPKADASVGRIQPDNGAGRSRAEGGGVEQGLTM